jgi:putative addiction module CopG family antidote
MVYVGNNGKSPGMSRNTSISLGDHFAAFIEAQAATGRYGSASDVVRAGILEVIEAHASNTYRAA